MVIGTIVGFLILILMDMSVLKKTRQKKKTLTVYFMIVGAALLISILLAIDKPPVSPSLVIESVVNFIK